MSNYTHAVTLHGFYSEGDAALRLTAALDAMDDVAYTFTPIEQFIEGRLAEVTATYQQALADAQVTIDEIDGLRAALARMEGLQEQAIVARDRLFNKHASLVAAVRDDLIECDRTDPEDDEFVQYMLNEHQMDPFTQEFAGQFKVIFTLEWSADKVPAGIDFDDLELALSEQFEVPDLRLRDYDVHVQGKHVDVEIMGGYGNEADFDDWAQR